jgi:hypothetical protein
MQAIQEVTEESAREQILWPWQGEPYRLWSLLDMRVFDVADVADGACNLSVAASQANSITVASLAANEATRQAISRLSEELRKRNVHLSVEQQKWENLEDTLCEMNREKIQKTLAGVREALKSVGLPQRFNWKLDRIDEAIRQERFDARAVHTQLTEAAYDLMAELQEPMFLHIDSERRRFYEQQEPPFGVDVETSFPDSARDIAAANRCYALDEWTACVFHSMRVLEHGLRRIAKRFSVSFTTDSWHVVIRNVEAEIDAMRNKSGLTEQDRTEITYYSDAASQFRYFKDAWRNHVSHAREHYDEREAEKVLTHVKEFMQHLAVRP